MPQSTGSPNRGETISHGAAQRDRPQDRDGNVGPSGLLRSSSDRIQGLRKAPTLAIGSVPFRARVGGRGSWGAGRALEVRAQGSGIRDSVANGDARLTPEGWQSACHRREPVESGCSFAF